MLIMIAQSSDWMDIRILLEIFLGLQIPKVNWNNQTQVHDIYLKHWLYNRADPHLQNFLKNTSMYSQWDDHEVLTTLEQIGPIGIVKTKIEQDIRILFKREENYSLTFLP